MSGAAGDLQALLDPLGDAVERVLASASPPRQERLSGIHNPFGPAAALVDPWAFLAVCEAPAIVGPVTRILGKDVILWDSELFLQARRYLAFVAGAREGRYWPVAPLAGALAICAPGSPHGLLVAPLAQVATLDLSMLDPARPLYVMRYMPATSLFRRDAGFAANRLAMEEQVLVSYQARPLWLVSGEDRAGNDFVTGFTAPSPRWAGPPMQGS